MSIIFIISQKPYISIKLKQHAMTTIDRHKNNIPILITLKKPRESDRRKICGRVYQHSHRIICLCRSCVYACDLQTQTAFEQLINSFAKFTQRFAYNTSKCRFCVKRRENRVACKACDDQSTRTVPIELAMVEIVRVVCLFQG